MNIAIDTYTPTKDTNITPTNATYPNPAHVVGKKTTPTNKINIINMSSKAPTTTEAYKDTTSPATASGTNGNGLTMEDIMEKASTTNPELQKDYMVVMSHCVSSEDYQKLAKDGFTPSDIDAETFVTMADRIKATLASSGVEVAGYTDTLDTDTLEAITGAITQALKIEDMSDDMVKYLVENNQPPTIENLYIADYSTAEDLPQKQGYYSDGAYLAKKADEIDLDNIIDQIQQTVTKAGFIGEENETAINTAKWLVESGIELNPDNLINAYNLKTLSLPLDKDTVTNLCINAVINGKSPYEANLTGEATIDQQSAKIIEEANNITDAQIHEAVEKGIDLNLKNLSNITTTGDTTDPTEASLKEIQAKRQMEEIRLMMSEEANRHLLRQGISIDTTDLSDLVEMLKQTEAQIKQTLYKGGNVDTNEQLEDLYNETLTKTDELANMPASILGPIAAKIGTYSIDDLYEAGTNSPEYDKTSEYEKLMTSPRSDLGDSIKKAFRNVDDILTELGLETSDSNRRAVRILGYNSMEITKQNIETIKQADRQVNDVIDKMTPANVLKMIRDQKNPLNMSMDELEDYLNKNKEESLEDSEKYSKFLQKLDQSGSITEDEKEAYIGIYRLFNQIEKTDGAVIGSIVASGAQMNFKNMLSAVRTSHNKNMDISIDDGFGALSELITGTKAIDAQINQGFNSATENENNSNNKNQEKYYASLSGQINKELSDKTDVSKLRETNINADTTIENFKDQLEDIRLENEDDYEEYQDYKDSLNQAMQASDEVIQELLDYSQPITTYNLEAAMLLNANRNEVFGKIEKMSKNFADDDIFEDTDSFIDGLEEKETVYDLYDEIIKSARQTLDNYLYNPNPDYVDIKAAQNMYKELSLMGSLSRQENYQVPMNLDGEVTNVNLIIYHNKEDAGKVSITLENNALGKIAAEFQVDEDKISGMVACQNSEAKEYLGGITDTLSEAFDNKDVNISLVWSDSINLEMFGEDRDKDNNLVTTRELYNTAKVFLKSLKNIGGNQHEN
jgi:hypothetical protein